MSQLKKSTHLLKDVDRHYDIWPEFVQAVLEITAMGYLIMQESVRPKSDWHENEFSRHLANYIRPLASEHPLNLQVDREFLVDRPAPSEERIDIALWSGSWSNYHIINFAWEAKKLGSANLYVTEGVYRFIDKIYSEDVRNAGMLGYMLEGTSDFWAEEINVSMGRLRKRPKLSSSNYLKPHHPIAEFSDVFYSSHQRVGIDEIQLHHFFLTFEFS